MVDLLLLKENPLTFSRSCVCQEIFLKSFKNEAVLGSQLTCSLITFAWPDPAYVTYNMHHDPMFKVRRVAGIIKRQFSIFMH